MSRRAELLAASESGESEVKDVIKAEKFRGRFFKPEDGLSETEPTLFKLEISSNSLYLLL